MPSNLELRIRHPKGSSIIDALLPNSSVFDLKREISKVSSIPSSRILLKMGYPPQQVDLPENTTLENIGLQSGETIIAEENKNAVEAAPSTNKNEGSQSVGKTQANTQATSNQATGVQQVPNPEGLIMVRRIIPADNSCLFNSIAYALDNKAKNKAKEYRNVVAGYIMSDPEKYNDVVLEKSNKEYCNWIQKDESWGGAIELEIFAKHFGVEICAVDIENSFASVFGVGEGYKQRIYVLYDGIHYDILVRNISEDMDSDIDITVFEPEDKFAYEGALALAKELKGKKQFTNRGNFKIECGICYEKFAGEQQAVEHNKKTGHMNFRECQ